MLSCVLSWLVCGTAKPWQLQQVFKWVRKSEKCEFKSDADNAESLESSAIEYDQAVFGGEAEGGQRRLTRGKAADMGLSHLFHPRAFACIVPVVTR